MDDLERLAVEFDGLVPEILRLIMQRLLTASPQDDDVTFVQAFLLRHIARRTACTAAAVGEILGITSGPVTTITSRLVKRGLLKRRRDTQDRRVVWFSLTEEGEAFVRRLAAHRQERWTLLLDRLGAEPSRELIRLLGRVEDVLRSLPEESLSALGEKGVTEADAPQNS